MASATIGGFMRETARAQLRPACREGRVSKVLASGRLEVAVRSLMGDVLTLPARCYEPRVIQGPDGVELLDAVKGDPVWVSEDEGGQLVVVGWEPLG
jgi:hypothetical protein